MQQQQQQQKTVAAKSYNASNDKKTVELPRQQKQLPIFIDRDSNRFSYVLDYMRDGCIVVLPVSISKESFLTDLEYYCFEQSTVNNNSSITCTFPTNDIFVQVQRLHAKFISMMQQNVQEKHYRILSYACFCECVFKNTLTCSFSWKKPDATLHLPSIINSKLVLKIPVEDDLAPDVVLLVKEYNDKQEQNPHGDHAKAPATNGINCTSAILFFNKCLADYGLQFKVLQTEHFNLKIHLK
jgi:BTB/POZ domain